MHPNLLNSIGEFTILAEPGRSYSANQVPAHGSIFYIDRSKTNGKNDTLIRIDILDYEIINGRFVWCTTSSGKKRGLYLKDIIPTIGNIGSIDSEVGAVTYSSDLTYATSSTGGAAYLNVPISTASATLTVNRNGYYM